MKNPLRFWRTGAVAVVLAALGGASFAEDASTVEEGSLECLSSPYDVDETVHRIELSARQRGVPVFGCFEQISGGASLARGGASLRGMRVVVLESVQGGTPVLMAAEGADTRDGGAFELPLSIRVRRGGDGLTEVWVESPQIRQDMLHGLEFDLAALDEVVRNALRT